MTHSLHHATPSSAGVDAAGIQRFIDALENDPGQDPHGLVVMRGGAVIAEGWWAPYSSARPQLVYSLSKSFTAAAAGALWDSGGLDLDRPVVDYFPELAGDVAPASRRILVRHVASMSTGHLEDMHPILLADDDEPLRAFFAYPPDREPGSVFAYNQAATYTLAAIVERVSGMPLLEYLRHRVLGPIGAAPIAWDTLGGRAQGYSGSYMTTGTIARLGQLLLDRGRWGERRVLSEEWVGLATTRQADSPPWGPDWACGYGFQHWLARHGYRGDGAYGQFCVVLPEHDTVIALQSQTEDMQATLDAMWEHMLPALDGGGSAEADEALADRLAGLTLPPLRVAPGHHGDRAAWDGAVFAADQRGWLSARVRHDSGWHVTLSDGAIEIDAALADDGWHVTEADGSPAVALSGGFDSPDVLRVDAVFLETPHRLHVVLDRTTGAATAKWETEPLRHERDFGALAAPHPFG